MHQYYVYILTNKNHTVLYIGVSNDLEVRLIQHKKKENKGFTSKYNVNKLVYYEEYNDIDRAISREKQLKNWKREWKIQLIEKDNPDWEDLSKDWFE